MTNQFFIGLACGLAGGTLFGVAATIVTLMLFAVRSRKKEE